VQILREEASADRAHIFRNPVVLNRIVIPEVMVRVDLFRH
jgi:hypothetical protein